MLLIEITSEQVWYIGSGVVGTFIIIGAVAAAWKSVRGEFFTPLKKLLEPRREKRKKLNELIPLVQDMVSDVQEIKAELKTNGGASIKDAVLRIDRKMEHLDARARHQDETSHNAIFHTDARGSVKFANAAFCELVGVDESDLLHRDWISRIRPDEQRRFLNELDTAIENKFPLDTTAWFRNFQGQSRLLRIQAFPHVRAGGELLGFFGTASRLDASHTNSEKNI